MLTDFLTGQHIKAMDRGLNVIIDNTDYFLLTSLKRSLNIFNKSDYYTGKITFENGCLRNIINDKYDIKR